MQDRLAPARRPLADESRRLPQIASQYAEMDEFFSIDAVAANGNDLQLDRPHVVRTNATDGADLLVWQRHHAPGHLPGWKANFGARASSQPSATPIPEPGTAGLLVVAGHGLVRNRDRITQCLGVKTQSRARVRR
jgi:hypothetical protein